MLRRGSALRQSFSSFSKDVDDNGIRGAIRVRRSRLAMSHEELAGISGTMSDEKSGLSIDTDIVQHSLDAEYTLGDHMEYLHIHNDTGGHFYADVSHLLCDSMLPNLVKDYCSPIPYQRLDAIYFGMEESSAQKSSPLDPEPLPVRTMAIRLRPDVMANVVLDAVQEACEARRDIVVQVLRRMEGRFRCLMVPGKDDEDPPFLLDANVCTNSGGVLDRQLMIRIYHAGDRHPKHKKQSEKQRKKEAIEKIVAEDGLMIPINLHLRGASSFLQFLSMQKGADEPMAVGSPKESPKASTAFFIGSYHPTFSVQLRKELKHVQSNHMFPSLNSEDWQLLQSSWTLLSTMLRSLTEHNCLFHMIVDVPMVDSEAEEGPTLDLHYCSQIRQLSRDRMLAEVASSFRDLKMNLDSMQRSYQNFVHMLQHTVARFQMARVQADVKSPPYLVLPSRIAPPGYTMLAAMACKCADASTDDPAALCDDAVLKVYKTFCSQDDHNSRKHLKEANATVMDRLVEIQKTQMDILQQLEIHPNAQTAAKEFSKQARLATNSKGRVERLLLARVPLLDFELIGGRCQVTSTAMLCSNDGMLECKYNLFDLKAVDFQMVSGNCVAILSDDVTREKIYKFYTAIDIPSLIEFLKTLQTLQSVFDLHKTDKKLPDEEDVAI